MMGWNSLDITLFWPARLASQAPSYGHLGRRVILDISLVTKKTSILNRRSRILVFPHCPLITNFHAMGAPFFFDYINTKPDIFHTITLNLHKNIEIFGNIVV